MIRSFTVAVLEVYLIYVRWGCFRDSYRRKDDVDGRRTAAVWVRTVGWPRLRRPTIGPARTQLRTMTPLGQPSSATLYH